MREPAPHYGGARELDPFLERGGKRPLRVATWTEMVIMYGVDAVKKRAGGLEHGMWVSDPKQLVWVEKEAEGYESCCWFTETGFQVTR